MPAGQTDNSPRFIEIQSRFLGVEAVPETVLDSPQHDRAKPLSPVLTEHTNPAYPVTPQLDVLWLGLQALGAVALCVALCLQVVRLAMVLVGGAGDRPPAFLRKLTVSSTAAHYISVGFLIMLFYLCTSGKLYAVIHTKSWWYLWHYWPS